MASPIDLPDEFATALAGNAEAKAIFERMPPSHQRETVRPIAEAKRPETRVKRSAQTVEWILSGKIGANYRNPGIS